VPPCLLRIRCSLDSGRRVGLWIPLFLLYPLILALALVVIPVAILALLFTRHRGKILPALRALPQTCRVVSSTCGLRIEVHFGGNHVLVAMS